MLVFLLPKERLVYRAVLPLLQEFGSSKYGSVGIFIFQGLPGNICCSLAKTRECC